MRGGWGEGECKQRGCDSWEVHLSLHSYHSSVVVCMYPRRVYELIRVLRIPSRSRDTPPKAWMDAFRSSSTPAPTIFTFFHSTYATMYYSASILISLNTFFVLCSCSCLRSFIFMLIYLFYQHTYIDIRIAELAFGYNRGQTIGEHLPSSPSCYAPIPLVVFLTCHFHSSMFIHRHIIGSRQIITRKAF